MWFIVPTMWDHLGEIYPKNYLPTLRQKRMSYRASDLDRSIGVY
ncbi:hypothetical protein GGD63_007217 [Bradyrhizobium sp. cir1]|nr:hypothetical protein [Bradyrhizobium sp. cir1]